MHQLLLLRHAKSSWDDRELTDHARPLNARGQVAATAMRGAIQQLGLRPDLLLVSTARRTRETAAALAPWDSEPRVDHTDALYLAPASELMAILREVPEEIGSVMVVAHNPGLHELALMLTGADLPARNEHVRRLHDSYPSGALAEFTLAGPWSSLRPGGGRLDRFLCPKDIATF